MVRYLKAAFWATPDLPGLRRVPVNVVFLALLLVLGFGFPGLWLLAMIVEAIYLYGLTSNERFRQIVDAQASRVEPGTIEEQRKALVAQLSPPRQQRLRHLEEKCTVILQTQRNSGNDELLSGANEEILRNTSWTFLKLLLAQQNLLVGHNSSTEAGLRNQVNALTAELAASGLAPSLREAKQSTLTVLHQRLASLEKRKEPLEKIESNLIRIEAQIDLALESANMQGLPGPASQNVDIAALLRDTSIFGEAGESVAVLDSTYNIPPPFDLPATPGDIPRSPSSPS